MDFELNEEQKQIKALVREFCEREIDPKRMQELTNKAVAAETADEVRANYPWDLVEKLHEVGLRQLAIPKEYGGTAPESEGNVTRAIAGEEAGYSGGAAIAALQGQWVSHRIVATNPYISKKQRDWFFSQLMENHRMYTGWTVSEPSGTADVTLPYDEPGASGKVFAHKDGDEWVINGEKMFSTEGAIADMVFAATRTDKKGPISQSMSFFWVPRNTPGITRALNRNLTADLSGNVQTNYDNVRVPESLLIGQVNKGYSIQQGIFNTKWTMATGGLGTAQKLYEQIRDYAKQRAQGGKPIIQHSHIEAMMGEIAVKLDALRHFLYRAAWESDQREKAGKLTNWYWCEGNFYLFKTLSLRLCEVAAEVYGGLTGSVDMPAASFIQQTYLQLSGGGTINMQAMVCSRHFDDR